MKDRDAELREELKRHLDMAVEDRVARGELPAEAAAAARREIGNLSQVQEATRDVWGGRWLAHLAQDLRYAARIFRRNPAFAVVAILSLALGIGANTALFEVVDAVRLRPLPVSDPDGLFEVRLATLEGARGNFQSWHPAVTQPVWRELQERQQAFDLFAWSRAGFNLSESGEARRADGLWVSGDFFNILALRAAQGRLLSPEDDRPGCAPRAVLSHAFWQRAYGGDPSVVGRTITLRTRPIEIVGIAPAGFHGLEVGRTFDVVLPLCAEAVLSADGKGRAQAGTTWWLMMFGRLKPGWTLERATAHLAAISPEIFRSTLPAGYPAVSVQGYLAMTLIAAPGGQGVSQLRESYSSPLWLLLGIAGLVLVIACANLANLLLARATAREREISVRLGLGASRGRIIRQLLTESLLLVTIGTVCAVVLAGVMARWLVAALQTTDTNITLPLIVDWRVLGFAGLLAVATCLLFGLAPAIRGTRVTASSVLRATSRGMSAGRESVALRRALVVVQIALSVALLFGSLLFVRTLRNVLGVDPGFRSEGLLVANVDSTRLGLAPDLRAAHEALVTERVQAIPGVEGAATVEVVPISGDAGGNDVWPERNRSARFNTFVNFVGAGYFKVLGARLVAGREFDPRDRIDSVRVVIVNETFAEKLGGAAAAIGQRITRESTPGTPEGTYEVVGVVENSAYLALKDEPYPTMYYSGSQTDAGLATRLMIRSSLPPTATTASITASLTNLDPRMTVSYTIVPTMIHDTLVQERLLAALSAAFGLLAAVLTMVGLYGLIAYSVTRRSTEIGVRMALGASRANILRLVLRETGVLLAVGVAVGAAVAMAGGQTASSLLFRVRPYDPLTLIASIVILSAIALAASYVPARRATCIEPVVALRAE
ncbi:MAG TPA: ABC transporter permease [Vicinamibacterales bacterium]|nr:ABC transporter permease [Vicinamibacterales bacterium]